MWKSCCVSVLLLLALSGCHSVTIEHVDDNTRHVYISRIGVHVALDYPVLGNATLESAISDVKRQARRHDAVDYVVVSSDVDYSFWRYFPLSLVFQPVYTTVSANLIVAGPEEGEAGGDPVKAAARD